MAVVTTTPEAVVETARAAALGNGRGRDRSPASLIFLGALWFSLFFGVAVLLLLLVTTAIDGSGRFDTALLTNYYSRIRSESTGVRAGILGSMWLMLGTALLAVPLGIASALYLEEFADRHRWYNRLIELNLQNLAAVPSVIYGLLAVAVMSVIGFERTGIVLGGAIALALLILPVIIITTREAVRAVPQEIRFGSLALGATVWQTTWRQTLPAAIPGIATGTILGLSRAIGEAAPLLLVGVAIGIRFDPNGFLSAFTALPMQIYNMTSQPQEAFQTAAAAAIIVLLAMILGMNALAIVIRNKFQTTW
ncbi:MAG: phosphate ABC transporter permease PstA [Nocardioides sp.]